MNKIFLNLGSGIDLPRGYISIDNSFDLKDIEEGIKTKKGFFAQARKERGAKFVKSDILHLPFSDNFADLVEMHQVIEHFRIKEVVPVLKEVFRVLRLGGKFRVSAPNFDNLCLNWLSLKIHSSFDIDRFLYHAEEFYGYQATDGETHRCPINPEFLQWALGQAGFKEGKVWIFPQNSLIPKKKFGLLSRQAKLFPEKPIFRTETIFIEITKT